MTAREGQSLAYAIRSLAIALDLDTEEEAAALDRALHDLYPDLDPTPPF